MWDLYSCYWDLIRANCFCRWLCRKANTCWQVWRPSTKHTAGLKTSRSVSLWVKGLWKYICQKNRGQSNFQKWLKWQNCYFLGTLYLCYEVIFRCLIIKYWYYPLLYRVATDHSCLFLHRILVELGGTKYILGQYCRMH